ncbi:peptidase inhibitor family I36 protein [Streptomyces sp. NPDC088719]|uniref:peptidase inhibitor family I36 protein n=1 Tax=Streptomyces sp. NPDC088719 TaxID=3365872 RepID=UPI0038182AD8
MKTGTTVLAVACAAVFMAPSAAAAQATQAKADTHCVANSDTEKVTCYDTFREAIAAATGGRITNASQEEAAQDKKFMDKLNAPADSPTARAASSSSHILGILYWDANYQGSSHLLLADSPCRDNSSWDFGWSTLYSTGFNDATSSIRTTGNCHMQVWEHANYTGASEFYTTDQPSLGVLNDQITSIKVW